MQQGMHEMDSAMSPDMLRSHYRMLALNLAISLVIMYVVMFAMIYSLGEFIQNINFLYMALMMWAPMGSLMLLTMGSMYKNKKLNMILHAAFGLVFILSFVGIRERVGWRHSISAVDDPAPFGGDPDVRTVVNQRSRDCAAVRWNRGGPEG